MRPCRSSDSRRARLALMLVALGSISLSVQAQTITWVTNTNPSGAGSLLAALQGLQSGQATLQDIRFNFPVTTPVGASNVIFLNQPMPNVVGANVRISGGDIAAGVIIDGNGHRPFSVAVGATTTALELNYLTIRRGGSIDSGGCVSVRNQLTALKLDSVRLEECRVYFQSAATGVRGGAVFAAGPLQVIDSVFFNNQIESSAAVPVASVDAIGGALFKEGAHAVTIRRARFENNRVYLNNTLPSTCASGRGGALGLNMPGSGLSVLIIDSIFINNGTPCRNPSLGFDIEGAGDGGAMVYYGNGANELTLENNYFTGNQGRDGGAVGVMQSLSTMMTARNNTFFANRAKNAGGGLALVNCCHARIEHNTFSDNIAEGAGQPSQLWLSVTNLIALNHNVLNGNNSCAASLSAAQTGVAGWNLYFGGSCQIENDTGSQFVSYMSWLLPPASNGGFIPTMRPAFGSAAIDAGNPAGCLAQDARYVLRPIDGDADGIARCDIGAVESTFIDALFKNGFE